MIQKRKNIIIVSMIMSLMILFLIPYIQTTTTSHNTYQDLKTTKDQYIESDTTPDNPLYDEMKKINSNYLCWLHIPNTNIDYPVVHPKDEQYYLTHDFYNASSPSGCLLCQPDYHTDDYKLIIYGHHMKNGEMFQNLMYFKNKEFCNQNQKIYLYTANGTECYQVAAVYNEPEQGLSNLYDDTPSSALVNYGMKKSYYHFNDFEVKINSQLLILVTCDYVKAGDRLVMIAIKT